MLLLGSCIGLLTARLRGEQVLTAWCTAVHIYAYCNFTQIKPLECSLAVAELETAMIILVNKAGSEHSLTGVAVVVFPGRASTVWGDGAGDRLHLVTLQ